jgi:D-apiose dehydrogenase
MSSIRFAVCGAGFWSHYQLAGWMEIEGVQCVAICDPDREKADRLAKAFSIPTVYSNVQQMLDNEQIDFVDVISSPSSHSELVRQVADRQLPVICQKPMTENWEDCRSLVEYCHAKGAWFAIHENWRWQSTLRYVKDQIDRGEIGDVFRCRLDMTTSFDVFENQPSLRTVPELIIADLGCHFLDYARCLFGEVDAMGCHTHRTLEDVAGENVASIMLSMRGGRTTVNIELAFAKMPMESDAFPQTRLFAEGTAGSIAVHPDYWVHTTSKAGTIKNQVVPKPYSWAHPKYAIVHSSIVECSRHLLESLRDGRPAETDALDNLRTMNLVFQAYEAARTKHAFLLNATRCLSTNE